MTTAAKPKRSVTANLPENGMMTAVLLQGHGGLDQLDYRTDVPIPQPGINEVLIKVGAAGINNTDINTRIGWYSKSVEGSTNQGGSAGFDRIDDDDASWSGQPLQFPRIQGADSCGEVVMVGCEQDEDLLGQRVLVRTMQAVLTGEDQPYQCITIGSECDGGFAQYLCCRRSEVFPVNCDWSDIELASIPCAYSTAENMLHRAAVGAQRVLITGASGGVGSAAVQLCKRRGAEVIALSSAAKQLQVLDIGADQVYSRDADLVAALGSESIDVVIDLVVGSSWPQLLDILKRGGTYITAGAIAGPIVELDARTLYLKDLTLMGSTWQAREVFENLVSYIENNEIKPLVSKSYPLHDIKQAQQDFLDKNYFGKLVLVPPKQLNCD